MPYVSPEHCHCLLSATQCQDGYVGSSVIIIIKIIMQVVITIFRIPAKMCLLFQRTIETIC